MQVNNIHRERLMGDFVLRGIGEGEYIKRQINIVHVYLRRYKGIEQILLFTIHVYV